MRTRIVALLAPAVYVALVSAAGGATLSRIAYGSRPDISADGRYVSFSTWESHVPGDTNGLPDIYVFDRATGTYQRATESSAGAQGFDLDTTDGHHSALSADGRHVAFDSVFSTLVPDDANGFVDVFVRDLDTGHTACVSVGMDGHPGNGKSISHYHRVGISGDGRFVAFVSDAGNLVPNDTNGVGDVFVRDRDTDGNGVFDEPGGAATERISVGPNGEEDTQSGGGGAGANITPDGRYVAFISGSGTLVTPDVALDDAYVWDRLTRTMERVSVSSAGVQGNGSANDVAITPDGRWVTFSTVASNLVPGDDDGTLDVFLRDRLTGTTTRVSTSPWYSDGPSISADGRYVSYYTFQAYTKVHKWVFDQVTGTTVQVDVDPSGNGTQQNTSRGVGITADARLAVFETNAPLLGVGGGGIYVAGCGIFQSPGEPDPAVCPADAFPLGTADRARFDAGMQEFARPDGIAEGLGPVFNENSCAACHNRPFVGGSGVRPVTRFGASGAGGFDPLVGQGGLVLQSQGIDTGSCSVAGEVLPAAATVTSDRDPPALFGLGLVEQIPEESILRLVDDDDRNHDGVTGRANMVNGRVGRFGRKASIATLREFAGDAYLNEMGITSPDFPDEIRPQGGEPLCDTVPDPEDDGTNVQAFTDFISLLAPLPAGRWASPEVKRTGTKGKGLFNRIGCRTCHTDRLRTMSGPIVAMSRVKVPMFSDLLLHDMGPGLADGIEEGQATGSEFRTAPLWGVVWSAPYLHDGRAATLGEAILLHGGEAQRARDAFVGLTATDQEKLLTFLRGL